MKRPSRTQSIFWGDHAPMASPWAGINRPVGTGNFWGYSLPMASPWAGIHRPVRDVEASKGLQIPSPYFFQAPCPNIYFSSAWRLEPFFAAQATKVSKRRHSSMLFPFPQSSRPTIDHRLPQQRPSMPTIDFYPHPSIRQGHHHGAYDSSLAQLQPHHVAHFVVELPIG